MRYKKYGDCSIASMTNEAPLANALNVPEYEGPESNSFWYDAVSAADSGRR